MNIKNMDIDTLRELILHPQESAKLDFKVESYKLKEAKPENEKEHSKWKADKDKAWAELIKDILALANGNIGTAAQTGYLIIGAEDKLKPDGSPSLHDVSDTMPDRKEILDKVNSYCQPQLPDIECQYLAPIDNKKLFVISIPPYPYLYRLSKQLITPKKEYSRHTVLVRRGDGEQTYEASQEEQEAISNDKRLTLSSANSNDSQRFASQERSQKLSVEIYERKIQIYRATRKFLDLVLAEGTVTVEQLIEFSRDTDEALFLFDEVVADYLQELYQNAVKLYSCDKRLSSSHLPFGSEASNLAEESASLLIWLTKQIEVTRNLFYKYISL